MSLNLLARRLLASMIGSCLSLAVMEVGLRVFQPTNLRHGLEDVDEEHPVAHFTPNRVSSSRAGPYAEPVELRINNAGFRNDQSYEHVSSDPLLAIIGDSYVAAVTVPFEDTISARLGRAAEGSGRVYSFAARGAGFGQYLAWAANARDRFDPDAFAFVIIANDFGDSVSPRTGFHHFERHLGDTSSLVRVDHHPSWRRTLSRRSALASFLLNLGAQPRPPSTTLAPRNSFVSNIPSVLPEPTLELYRWAFDSFVGRLPAATGLPYDRIVFIVDGFRPNMYEPESLAVAEASAWAQLREHAIRRAEVAGIEVVDLHAFFTSDFEQRGLHFEPKRDNHWNSYGHGVAADAASTSSVFRETFWPGE